jgi:bifunctional non-homologous end joining protein LigD
MLAKLPATPAGSPAYRVEGEILDGKFHVFDMVVVGQESEPYEVRKAMADAWVDAVSPQLPQAAKLPTAKTAKEKQALWDKVLASGAEGVMMKRKDAGYSGGQRVSHTLKAKITATADVVVLERNRGGKDNAVFGLLKNGKVTEIGTVSTGGKDKALGQIQVGEVLEVEYLWAMPGGTLTQPRIVRKRPDKTPADATDITQLRVVDKTVLALAAKRLRLELEQKAGL